jgi:hypothetical protein
MAGTDVEASFEMNATLFQVGNPHTFMLDWANKTCEGHNVRFSYSLSIALTKISRFIEENKSYKIASQKRQSQQVSQPGRPSQDMMSFWGKIQCLRY